MATRTRPRKDRRTRAGRSESHDAREDLFNAAVEVFAERGYRRASVDEIAERAGYSKGAVYWHFSSKNELFFALIEERVDSPLRAMIELLATAPTTRDMSAESNVRFVDFLRSQRPLLLLDHEYWSQAARDPKVRRRYADRQARLRSALGAALRARTEHLGGPALDNADGERWATVIMSLVAGLAQEWLVRPSAVADDLLGEAIAMMYRGLLAKELGVAEPRVG